MTHDFCTASLSMEALLSLPIGEPYGGDVSTVTSSEEAAKRGVPIGTTLRTPRMCKLRIIPTCGDCVMMFQDRDGNRWRPTIWTDAAGEWVLGRERWF